jgi:hypothetical protein
MATGVVNRAEAKRGLNDPLRLRDAGGEAALMGNRRRGRLDGMPAKS